MEQMIVLFIGVGDTGGEGSLRGHNDLNLLRGCAYRNN